VSFLSWEISLPANEGVFFYIFVFEDEGAAAEAYTEQRFASINSGTDTSSATPVTIAGTESTCMNGNNPAGTNSFAVCAVPFGAVQVFALANFQVLPPGRTEQDIAAETAAYGIAHVQAVLDALP
jgi:hypothetical protein